MNRLLTAACLTGLLALTAACGLTEANDTSSKDGSGAITVSPPPTPAS